MSKKETIKEKILYDEREWRSVCDNFIPDDINPLEYVNEEKTVVNKGYLNSNCNLKFTDKDLVEIILKDENEKQEK